MKHNKTFYILKRDMSKTYVEEVKGADCSYDERLFIIKDDFSYFVLCDRKSGQSLTKKTKLKELKNWFVERGKEAYNQVVKNNLNDYQKRCDLFASLRGAK